MDSQNEEEYKFLCGLQKVRKYGSTNDSNDSSLSIKYSRLHVHKIEPTDTLQSLELKYNSSMFEIKRINKLWCDQSLHCKAHLLIPIYDGSPEPNLPICSASSTQSKTTLAPISASTSKSGDANSIDESEHDSLDKIFKRIDLNVRHTKMSVKRLDKLSRYEFES